MNIERDLTAAEYVGGQRREPDRPHGRVADGTALTNPSLKQVTERLAASH